MMPTRLIAIMRKELLQQMGRGKTGQETQSERQ